jgi:hypothetical protein
VTIFFGSTDSINDNTASRVGAVSGPMMCTKVDNRETVVFTAPIYLDRLWASAPEESKRYSSMPRAYRAATNLWGSCLCSGSGSGSGSGSDSGSGSGSGARVGVGARERRRIAILRRACMDKRLDITRVYELN